MSDDRKTVLKIKGIGAKELKKPTLRAWNEEAKILNDARIELATCCGMNI
jgi:hypothetical protein